MGIWNIHGKHWSSILYSCCPCIPPRTFQHTVCFVQVWRGCSQVSHQGPRHWGHLKSWICALGNKPPAQGDCKEKGWQFVRCYLGAQSAVSLSSEVGFQYTHAGKLSLAHVLSETNLSQVATGFRGLGQRRVLQENAWGSNANSFHICVVDGVTAEKNGSQKRTSTHSGSAGCRVGEELQQESFPTNWNSRISQCLKQDTR